jgi:hypothetical protein
MMQGLYPFLQAAFFTQSRECLPRTIEASVRECLGIAPLRDFSGRDMTFQADATLSPYFSFRSLRSGTRNPSS